MDSTPKKSTSEELLTAASSDSGDLSLGALQKSDLLATEASSSSTLTDNVEIPQPRRVISLTNALTLDEPVSKKTKLDDALETVPEQDSVLSQPSNAHPSTSEAKSDPLVRNRLYLQRGDDSDESPRNYGEGGFLQVKTGDVLGDRYEIKNKLGHGGSATAWMAYDKKSEKFVALKISKSSERHTNFSLREIEILKVLGTHRANDPRSNAVAELLDDFKVIGENESEHIVMVLELIGPNLNTVLQNSIDMNFHIDNIRKICQQVLQGLAFLHDTCGVIHCDIKPENIMLVLKDEDIERMANIPSESSGKVSGNCESYDIDFSDPKTEFMVKIGDFGMGRRNEVGEKRHPSTCYYRAPEEWLLGGYNFPIDMWSFGCLVYELVTRCILFNCSDVDVKNKPLHYAHHISSIIARRGDIPLDLFRSSNNEEHLLTFFSKDGKFEPSVDRADISTMREVGWSYSMSEQDAGFFEDFVLGFLTYDPEQRCTADDGLRHQFVHIPTRLPSEPDHGYIVGPRLPEGTKDDQ